MGRESFLKLNGLSAQLGQYKDFKSCLERVFHFGKGSLEYVEDVKNMQKELSRWPLSKQHEYEATAFSPKDEMDAVLAQVKAGKGPEEELWIQAVNKWVKREKKEAQKLYEDRMKTIKPFLASYTVPPAGGVRIKKLSVTNNKTAKLHAHVQNWKIEGMGTLFRFRYSAESESMKAGKSARKRMRAADE